MATRPKSRFTPCHLHKRYQFQSTPPYLVEAASPGWALSSCLPTVVSTVHALHSPFRWVIDTRRHAKIGRGPPSFSAAFLNVRSKIYLLKDVLYCTLAFCLLWFLDEGVREPRYSLHVLINVLQNTASCSVCRLRSNFPSFLESKTSRFLDLLGLFWIRKSGVGIKLAFSRVLELEQFFLVSDLLLTRILLRTSNASLATITSFLACPSSFLSNL